ncbi:retrovirus-related pol polyprotein from transposon TNT 1-94 [Tanacetum coccineum]
MEVAVQQSSVDKQCLEIAKKEILLENDRLLQKIMSQDVLLIVMNSMFLNNDSVNMKMQECESCEKCLNLDAELSKSKQTYNDFLKNYSQLEKHCISLEASMQLEQEVFQNDESCVNQNAVEIQEYIEINDLKARLQDKDKTICKLKDTIKSSRENTKEENVNHDKYDLEPINKELENSVVNILSENERLCNEINHVKQIRANAIIPSAKKGLLTMNSMSRKSEVFYSNCGSKPPGNKRNDRISQSPSCPNCTLIRERPDCKDHGGKAKNPLINPKLKEKLYLLHMDLCGPMRVASINGKRYLIVIVDDYSRFTWVKFLKTKDEAPTAIIKCIKNIQVRLKATVQNVRTDNGTEFVNQTLREWYENVGITHQTSVARTPQQNGLGSNPVSQQPCLPPIRDDWDRLFQPMFDEYFNPPPIVVYLVQEAAASRAEVLADSPVSTSID